MQNIATDGSGVYVADDRSAYSIPIEADGGIGEAGAIRDGFAAFAGYIAAHSGRYCGGWRGGVGGGGLMCNTSFLDFFVPPSSGQPTMPACGIVYSGTPNFPSTPGPTLNVIADRDLSTNWNGQAPPVLQFAPDGLVYAANDGMNIYFLNTAGEIRVLPLP